MQNNNNGGQHDVIGVYGGANVPPGTPDYVDAYHLGAELARAGYAVMTGGYSGTMEAISHGAAQADGYVIGVTVALFKERGLMPNPFLTEEIHLPTLAARLNYLIAKADAYVFLKGGTGTLSELALAWSLMQVAEVPPRPMVLVGPMWRKFLTDFAAISTVAPRDLGLMTLVDSVRDVIPTLQAWWASPPPIQLRLGDVLKTPPSGDR